MSDCLRAPGGSELSSVVRARLAKGSSRRTRYLAVFAPSHRCQPHILKYMKYAQSFKFMQPPPQWICRQSLLGVFTQRPSKQLDIKCLYKQELRHGYSPLTQSSHDVQAKKMLLGMGTKVRRCRQRCLQASRTLDSTPPLPG